MRVLSIISLIFTLVVVVAVIVFFAIPKSIPVEWANQAIVDSASALRVGDFAQISSQDKMGCKKVVTQYEFDENGVQVLQNRIAYASEMCKTSEGLVLRNTITEYDATTGAVLSEQVEYYYKKNDFFYRHKDGAETEILGTIWQNAITSSLIGVYPVDEAGEYLFAEMSQNIASVNQIGVFVTGRCVSGDDTLDITFDFLNRQLKSLTHTHLTKADGVNTFLTVTEYQLLFPRGIELPTAETAGEEASPDGVTE